MTRAAPSQNRPSSTGSSPPSQRNHAATQATPPRRPTTWAARVTALGTSKAPSELGSPVQTGQSAGVDDPAQSRHGRTHRGAPRHSPGHRHRSQQRDRRGHRAPARGGGFPGALCRAPYRPDRGPGRRDRWGGHRVRRHRTRVGRGARRAGRTGAARAGQQRGRGVRRRHRRGGRPRGLGAHVRRQRARHPACHPGTAPGAAGQRRRAHREHGVHGRKGRLRGRWRLHRRQARTQGPHGHAPPRAERRADPGDGGGAGDGAHRRVLRQPLPR